MAHLLLVDDDPVIGQLLCDTLIAAGHAIGWISDGEAALRVMRAKPPHLAIVDCAMPGMSGVQLVRTMRSDGRLCHIPTMMLTARQSINDEAIGYSAGADDYLRKPVDLDLLVGRIEALLIQSQGPSAIAV